jgi:hypothetical protein
VCAQVFVTSPKKGDEASSSVLKLSLSRVHPALSRVSIFEREEINTRAKVPLPCGDRASQGHARGHEGSKKSRAIRLLELELHAYVLYIKHTMCIEKLGTGFQLGASGTVCTVVLPVLG